MFVDFYGIMIDQAGVIPIEAMCERCWRYVFEVRYCRG